MNKTKPKKVINLKIQHAIKNATKLISKNHVVMQIFTSRIPTNA